MMHQTDLVRDTHYDMGFWRERLARQAARIDKFAAHYDTEPSGSKRKRNAGQTLVGLLFDMALAEYSSGLSIETVGATLRSASLELWPDLIAMFPPTHEFGVSRPGYPTLHRHIAALILTRANTGQAERLFAALDALDLDTPDYGRHCLIWSAYRARFGVPDPHTPSGVRWPEAYGALWSAIDPATPGPLRSGHLRTFLDQWYDLMKGELAAQTERMTSPADQGQFVGYWCLEAASAAVAFGIDDGPCRSHPHYPADWADWARGA